MGKRLCIASRRDLVMPSKSVIYGADIPTQTIRNNSPKQLDLLPPKLAIGSKTNDNEIDPSK